MRSSRLALLGLGVVALLPLRAVGADGPDGSPNGAPNGAPDAALAEARKAKLAAAKAADAAERQALGEQVNAAIDKGVAWLKGRQKSTGAFPAYGDKLPPNTYSPMDLGVNALVLLTLAKCGVPADDRVMAKGRSWCFANYANMKGLKKVLVYPSAVLLMALEAMYNPEAREEVSSSATRYGSSTTRKKSPCKYPAQVASLVDELTKFLVRTQVGKVGGWRYPGVEAGAPPGDAEISNTQYALLGLNAAARCGATVPAEVFTKALAYVLAEQDRDGIDADLWLEDDAWEPGVETPRFRSAGKRRMRGWRYTPDGAQTLTTGSMTTAGIACLAIVKERLADLGKLTPETARRIDSAMLDGLVWLGELFTVESNPTFPAGGAPWHLYYLYGLERVGALTGFATMGKHEWYPAGARFLVGAQKPDGKWEGQLGTMNLTDEHESEVVQTCFALLFLRRSTSPPTVPVKPQVTTGDPEAPPTDHRGR